MAKTLGFKDLKSLNIELILSDLRSLNPKVLAIAKSQLFSDDQYTSNQGECRSLKNIFVIIAIGYLFMENGSRILFGKIVSSNAK
jgi:hypothetical protein